MPLIIPASQTLAAGGYDIDNSCRFNDDDTPAVTRTSSTGNERTFTLSVWVKLGSGTQASSYYGQFFAARTGSSGYYGLMQMLDYSGLTFHFGDNTGASCRTLNKYRDCSAWYHVVYKIDSTESTDTDRVKIYVNGELATLDSPTYPSLNDDFNFNTGAVHHIGKLSTSGGSTDYFDGYMAEMHWIDGTALDADSFGEFDETYGHWKPIEVTGLTYGTNGFYLDFKDSSDLGNDVSGEGNDFTTANLTASDQMTDTPTNNFCTWDSVNSPVGTLSEGNLKVVGTIHDKLAVGTFPMSSGKWYWEVQVVANGARNFLGVVKLETTSHGTYAGATTDAYAGVYGHDGATYQRGGTENAEFGSSFSAGDIITICFDADNGSFWLNQNAYPDTSATALVTSLPSGLYNLMYSEASGAARATNILNAGQDGTFAGTKTAQGNADDNEYGNFYYAPPTGFLALCTKNLEDCAVTPSEHFNTILYDDGAGAKTGVGFQPDLVWLKSRGSSYEHEWTDAVRGVTKALSPDSNNIESTDSTGLTAFGTDGFTVGADTNYSDTTGDGMMAFCWKANGSGSSNGDGSITSTVSANTSAGFSIVSYSGDNSTATVGHGLSKAPELLIVKRRSGADNWTVGSIQPAASMDFTDSLLLDTNGALVDETIWNDIAPTSSVFTVTNNTRTNGSGSTYIAYCWHSVEGYSKVGSYSGNGSDDGSFIYCGFEPAFLIVKTELLGQWTMFDNKRIPTNPVTLLSKPSTAATEEDTSGTYKFLDFLSNGFKFRLGGTYSINLANEFIYIAFADKPFKYANAR